MLQVNAILSSEVLVMVGSRPCQWSSLMFPFRIHGGWRCFDPNPKFDVYKILIIAMITLCDIHHHGNHFSHHDQHRPSCAHLVVITKGPTPFPFGLFIGAAAACPWLSTTSPASASPGLVDDAKRIDDAHAYPPIPRHPPTLFECGNLLP